MQNLLAKEMIVLEVHGEDGYQFICVSVDAAKIWYFIASNSEVTVNTEWRRNALEVFQLHR